MKYLSINLPAGKGLRAYVCERPALCLSNDALAGLEKDLRLITKSILGDQDLQYGVFDRDSPAMSRSLITVIYERKTKRPIAFNALPLLEVNVGHTIEPVLHLGLVMIDPTVRSKGLSSMLYGFSCVLLFIKNQLRPMWISSVTQVPAVVGLVAELYSDAYPGCTGTRRSFYQKILAKAIMDKHRDAFGVGPDANFDEDHFIIRNAYTGGSDSLKKTYEATAKHRIDAYNEMCLEKLDYERGDDFLQIGLLDGRALRKYLMRMIPEGHIVGVVAALVFFIFRAVLLPMFYWFDNTKKWAGLRPYEV